MSNLCAIVLFSVIITCGQALELPEFIKACSRNDKNLNDCALNSAKAAFPGILKGNPKFNIPPLAPLFVPSIIIDSASGLNVSLINCTVFGLDRVEPKKVEINLDKNQWVIHAYIPVLNLISQYDIKGRILILPITGNGPSNITFTDANFVYTLNYDLIKKNGKEFADIKDSDLKYDLSRAYFNLENLFNGDPTLGPETNKFIDANWKEVLQELGPAITEAIKVIISRICTGYITKVPFNKVFLP